MTLPRPTAREYLEETLTWLAPPDRWIKETWVARDYVTSAPRAACTLGGMLVATELLGAYERDDARSHSTQLLDLAGRAPELARAIRALANVVAEPALSDGTNLIPYVIRVMDWNDYSARTHGQVLDALRDAIKRVVSEDETR